MFNLFACCNLEVPIRLFFFVQALVFDFQPKDPENIFVALDVIAGRPVPGEVFLFFQIFHP